VDVVQSGLRLRSDGSQRDVLIPVQEGDDGLQQTRFLRRRLGAQTPEFLITRDVPGFQPAGQVIELDFAIPAARLSG